MGCENEIKVVFLAVAERGDVGYVNLEKRLVVDWVPHEHTFFVVAGETSSVWVQNQVMAYFGMASVDAVSLVTELNSLLTFVYLKHWRLAFASIAIKDENKRLT